MLSIVRAPYAPLQPLWPLFCPSNMTELLPMLFSLLELPPPPTHLVTLGSISACRSQPKGALHSKVFAAHSVSIGLPQP